jgi:hypothetical protein
MNNDVGEKAFSIFHFSFVIDTKSQPEVNAETPSRRAAENTKQLRERLMSNSLCGSASLYLCA